MIPDPGLKKQGDPAITITISLNTPWISRLWVSNVGVGAFAQKLTLLFADGRPGRISVLLFEWSHLA